ncbi:MAG: NUDIX hydrolase [Akkermansiaceae bacterium]
MSDEVKTLAEGKYLGLYERGTWEFAERPSSTSVVGILPITDGGEYVLIEQFRIPVQANVIEIPAGLVGDEPEHAGEPLDGTAQRELLEETGYRADTITPLLSSPTSAGMTTEITHLFAATGLHREHEGGGVDGENITVHHVGKDDLGDWLDRKQREGCHIDFKIHACLYLAKEAGLTD